MNNQMTVYHNGKNRNITNFTLNGSFASGRVSGRDIKVEVADYCYAYKRPDKASAKGNAAHCLIHTHDKIYGDAPLTPNERAKCRRTDVTDAHIKYVSEGRVRLTCKVDGDPVTIDYRGTVVNDNKEILTAKPFLGAARDDARRKARTMKRLRELMAEMESVVMSDASLKCEVGAFLTKLTA